MNVVMYMSLFWTLYGIAGLLGFQNIPAKFKGHSWTEEYTRKQGLTWLLLGLPYLILSLVITRFFPELDGRHSVTSVAIIILGLPAFGYSVWLDRVYKARLKKELEEAKQSEEI